MAIKFPMNVVETFLDIDRLYGFYDQILDGCNQSPFDMNSKNASPLPIEAVVHGNVFCIHGGLLPYLKNVKQFEVL